MNGYLIVEASTASSLEERVQELRQRGYEPQGGVSVTVTRWEYREIDPPPHWSAERYKFTQAMTRYWEAQDFTMDPDEIEALLRESTVAGVPV